MTAPVSLSAVQGRQAMGREIGKVFRGDERFLDWLVAGLLAPGHILLEDIPGVGKTLLAKALARVVGGAFTRVQGTPDLVPADLLGFSVYNPQDGQFSFRPGPLETNIFLLDELNRASPRTQAALLQAMAEGEISRDGQTRPLPRPFLVLATENSIDFEGTFPLPEAQKDRFLLSFALGYPGREAEASILTELPFGTYASDQLNPVCSPDDLLRWQAEVSTVWVSDKLIEYILDLTQATRSDPGLRLGLSPRGAQALLRAGRALALLRGRSWVTPDDLKELFLPVARHRVLVKAASLARGLTAETILTTILDRVPTPLGKETAPTS